MCDARQAKRLFAIFVSAGILGTQNLLILYAIALDVAVLYPVLWISINFIFVLFALGIRWTCAFVDGGRALSKVDLPLVLK